MANEAKNYIYQKLSNKFSLNMVDNCEAVVGYSLEKFRRKQVSNCWRITNMDNPQNDGLHEHLCSLHSGILSTNFHKEITLWLLAQKIISINF